MSRLMIEIGDWGAAFYVTDEGTCGVQDCNGDRVELEPEQWLRVVQLLAEHLPLPDESSRTRHTTVPGRVTLTTHTKD